MNADFNSEESIFEGALGHANEEDRRRYLEEKCGGNTELLKRLEELLVCYEEAEELRFCQKETPGSRDRLPVDFLNQEVVGEVIGRYQLEAKVGEGGFGVVYRAEQMEPIRRWVALKIIKIGMDTREMIARFDAERQALALMDHPNIARVLDAGSTGAGRPFFVMEIVEGETLVRYCDGNQLSIADRL